MKDKLPPKFKARWLEALRSGKYEQTIGTLHYKSRYCCLGVACKIQGYSDDLIDNACLPFQIKDEIRKVPKLLKTPGNRSVAKVADMNDDGKSFEQIADWIEQNL